MASVASASPSGHSYQRAESTEDSESWNYIESNEASSLFFPSPGGGSMASGSFNGSGGSWVMTGYPNQVERSPAAAVSPLHLDTESQIAPSAQSFPGDQSDPSSLMATGGFDTQFLASFAGSDQPPFITDSNFMLPTEPFEQAFDISPYYSPLAPAPNISANNVAGMSELQTTPAQPIDLGIPMQFVRNNDVSPWGPTNLKEDAQYAGTPAANFLTPEAVVQSTPPSSGGSSYSGNRSSSPRSPEIKMEKAPSPIRRIKGSKIQKNRAEPESKFVIMTPMIINDAATGGKPNPFECFEAMRTTHRGRKGPLADKVKESALQVRRLGACFCCHARKVKCDKERPCRNCTKLTTAVPQIICWQFQDFLPVLFPDFTREHFKKEQMAAFISENIECFMVNGVEKACEVELFSGTRFRSTLNVRAKFFTAKTPEVLQHWHINVTENQLDLQTRGAVPIGIDMNNASYREDLRRRTRDYVQAITFEPEYAEQVTDSFRHTTMPRRVLKIVQKFAQGSDSALVKRALSIYAMHYVLTRHLCITQGSILSLQDTNQVPRNVPWVTPRVLNRQVKSLLDEQLQKEMQGLFDGFSRSLKPKTRRDWAPCLAAFLVLCLFMEAVEAAADTFVVTQNEVNIRNRTAPAYRRKFALDVCSEIENMPFRQFAYQFHQVYQTHSRDASTKAFNPLMVWGDEGPLGGSFAELKGDIPAQEMVLSLRELLEGDNYHELDFLSVDPILPNDETHPFPRDVSYNYSGRLLSRFLLSFLDDKYLFDGKF